tara:strand:- start:7995 stop:9107 length:1113 start_codon:yes stop_codon:yes gene_type:complete
MSSKIYPTCLTRDYLSRWDLSNAVRESIQNFIDCGEDNYQLYRFGNTIEMESFVGTIDPKNLLLGVGSKTNDENSRGGFSEGLLLSLLIFARENVDMTFINGDKQWVPTFDWNEDYKCETLYIVEEDAEDPVDDSVKIVFELPSRVADEVELNTLQMQNDYAKFETDEGTILLDKEHQGRIYVGGLFVDNFRSEYGFDFPPQCFALDRDRKSLDPWSVKWQVRQLISQMSESEEIDEDVSDRLVTSMSKGDEAFGVLDDYKVGENKSLITSAEKLYKENYDGKILTSDYDEAEKLKEAGNKNVAYCNNKSFVKLVQKSDSHKVVFGARKEKEEVSVEDLLDNFEEKWQIDMDTEMYEAWRELSEKIKSQI